MELKCPQCHKHLPEVENLEYRFCPMCGAEITVRPEKLDDAFLTVPPDLSAQQPRQKSNTFDSEKSPKVTFAEKSNNKTIAPQSMATLSQPELKPPDTPPPSSFHRIRSVENAQPTLAKEKNPPNQIIKQRSPSKKRNIIIVGLVILALIILALGGVFTF